MRVLLLATVASVTLLAPGHGSSLSDIINEKIGHAVYHAAYDVLQAKLQPEPRAADDKLLDFLSEVVRSGLDEGSDHDTAEPESHLRVNRAKRSLPVPRVPWDEQSFMHSYVKRTGVGKLCLLHFSSRAFCHTLTFFFLAHCLGNREEIDVTSAHELPARMKFKSQPYGFRTLRFNSTNYVLAVQQSDLTMYALPAPPVFDLLDQRHIACHIGLAYEGRVLHAELYTEFLSDHESLRIALLLQTHGKAFHLRSFELTADRTCPPVTMIELPRQSNPLRVRTIHSHYESAVSEFVFVFKLTFPAHSNDLFSSFVAGCVVRREECRAARRLQSFRSNKTSASVRARCGRH